MLFLALDIGCSQNSDQVAKRKRLWVVFDRHDHCYWLGLKLRSIL